jgi:CheY-like chemotaxis protein
MLQTLLVEDNPNLSRALKSGLENTGVVRVFHTCGSGQDALAFCLNRTPPDVTLMDVQLEGEINGIQVAVEIRREYPVTPSSSTLFRMMILITGISANPAFSAITPMCANLITCCPR